MLKSKRSTYLLVIAVICVWGVIGFKIMKSLKQDVVTQKEEVGNNFFVPKTIKTQEYYTISTVSRDPFLGKMTPLATTKKIQVKKAKPNLKNKVNEKITYGGSVINHQSSTQIFVVNINNKQHLLKAGQTVAGLTIIEGDIRQIKINYNNNIQIIKHK